MIGFGQPMVTMRGGIGSQSTATIPLVRRNGTDNEVSVDWRVDVPSELREIIGNPRKGTVQLNDGEDHSTIDLKLEPNWEDLCTRTLDVSVELLGAHGALLLDETNCVLQLVPGMVPALSSAS